MKKITFVFTQLIILLIITGSHNALAQNTGYYAFIPNETGDIDLDGFQIGYHAVYPQWDLDGDGDISEVEFHNAIFKRLDSNNDGELSREEWEPGQKYLFDQFLNNGNEAKPDNRSSVAKERAKDSQNKGFNRFDTNNDKTLTSIEFNAGLRHTGIFQSFDSNRDGKLSRNELNEQVYYNMDLDKNGIIEKEEFEISRKFYIN